MQVDEEFRWAPGSEAPLEEWSIPRLFSVAARMVSIVGARLADRQGVSAAGFFLLRTLLTTDGLSSGEVARRCWITPATVTSVVDTLVRDGYVERRRDDGDRRVVRLHLTDKGRRSTEQTQEQMVVDMRQLYDFIDPADEAAIRGFLLGLIERFSVHTKGDLP